MATLHEGEMIKYEIAYRFGNTIMRKEFASRESALEFANSSFIKSIASWVALQTLERIK